MSFLISAIVSNRRSVIWLWRSSAIAVGCIALCVPVKILAQQPNQKSNEPVYIGFLEDDRKEMANWAPGVSSHRLIRPAFVGKDESWERVGDLDHQVTWTIAFDGRKLGSVRSAADSDPEQRGRNPRTSDYYGGTHLILTPATDLPNVGEPSQKFAGILAYGPGKVRRPLVVVSKPNFTDPNAWKRTKLPNEIAKLVRAAFRREFPHVDLFKKEEIVQRNWKFSDSDLELPTAYASNKDSFLVKTALKAEHDYVDDPNDPYADPWFFVSPNREVYRIGAFMELLDAGDYDGDGKSEVIFFLSQPEDTDGYVLFYDDFRKKVELTWEYH